MTQSSLFREYLMKLKPLTVKEKWIGLIKGNYFCRAQKA